MSTTLEPAQDRQSAAPSGRAPRPGLSRDSVERRVFGVLRWVVIAFLLVITIFPFYYTVMLSIRSLDEVLQDPGPCGCRRTNGCWTVIGASSRLRSPAGRDF